LANVPPAQDTDITKKTDIEGLIQRYAMHPREPKLESSWQIRVDRFHFLFPIDRGSANARKFACTHNDTIADTTTASWAQTLIAPTHSGCIRDWARGNAVDPDAVITLRKSVWRVHL